MRSSLVLALVLVLAVALDGGGIATAQAATRSCSPTDGADIIQATNVRCARARRVVRTWARGYARDGRVNRAARGFRCRDRSKGGLFFVACRRGAKLVKFHANVP